MPLDAITNFGYATLAAGIDSDDTSITLTTGHGARLPSTAFNATIWDTSYSSAVAAYHAGAAEIVRVTARSTDTLTVTRAQESTTARSFNTSGRTYAIGVAMTKATYDQLAPAASPTFTGIITTSAAVVAAGSATTGGEFDVTKLDNTYAASSNATLTFSATPATGTIFGGTITVDGTSRTLTFPSSYSQNQGGTVTTATFPANGIYEVFWKKTATGYTISGDPPTAAQQKAALAITQADVTDLVSDLALKAPLASPTFTGIPTVPTASPGTNTTQASSTAFVTAAIAAIGAGSGDVVGPASATDNAIARFNGTGGKTIQNGGPTINDSGEIEIYGDTIPGSLKLADGDATSPETLTLTAPVDITTSYVVIFPDAAGTAGQVLSIASVSGTTLTLQWSTP